MGIFPTPHPQTLFTTMVQCRLKDVDKEGKVAVKTSRLVVFSRNWILDFGSRLEGGTDNGL